MRRFLTEFFAACFVFTSSMSAVAAQEATPVSATPVGDERVSVLFVQAATGSTLTPLDAAEGEATHQLTLSGGTGQTVYFADRPNREVGTIATAEVIEGFSAEPGDPPNAALVAQTADGDEEIVVVVLLNGTVDEATGDVTYQVSLLADFAEAGLALKREPVTEITEAREYGASHLFIDDAEGFVFNDDENEPKVDGSEIVGPLSEPVPGGEGPADPANAGA